MKECETPVLGTGYIPGALSFCQTLPVGTPVKLVREPDNPYDPFAIAVFVDGRHIGYIPNKGYSCSECWGPVDIRLFVCKKCGSDQVVSGGLATRLTNANLIENSEGFISENLGENVQTPVKIRVIFPIKR